MVELIKDYNIGINYQLGEVNVVTDAWSQRSHWSQLVVEKMSLSCAKSLTR
jgi:hypothetical protein